MWMALGKIRINSECLAAILGDADQEPFPYVPEALESLQKRASGG